MPFGIAEAIATISAAMQAIDLYAKFGGSQSQIIQTLNLEYQPSRYVDVEQKVLSLGASAPRYTDLFKTADRRVQECIEGFTAAIGEDQLPMERERLAASAKACVCRQIKLLKDFMGEYIPEELKDIWRVHECDDFFGSSQGHNRKGQGSFVQTREPATSSS